MTRALRLCFIFALLAVPAFAQTAATRATLYTEIDTLFADTGADPITPAQLRQSLKNITASSYNGLTDGVVSSTYLPLTGGTLTGVVNTNLNGSSGTPWFTGPILTGTNSTNTAYHIDTFAAQGRYDIRRANGTQASPTALLTGNVIGGFAARGYNGTAYTGTVGSLLFTALGNWAASGTANYGTIATVAIVPQNQTTQVTAATFGNNSLLSLGNAATFPAWTTDGAVFNTMAATYTNGTSSGTVPTIALHSLGVPTLAATSATTYTDAANLYIAGDVVQGTNATLTNSYGLLNAGKTKLSGAVTLGSTINKVTLTAPATGSTLTIADGKTLTASNTLTLTATDGSTLAIGAGGTLGTAAYTASSAYATSAQGTKADNVGAVNGIVKSNGSASFSAASAGTDYVVPAGNVATATALATPRAIYGNNFDGSAALTQIIASTYGGTGNGFAKFSGPTTSEKTFTLPNSSATLLYAGGDAGTPSALVLTNATALPAAQVVAGALADGMTATTQTVGDNDTSLATTAFANAAAKATKLGSHASPDTTGGAITWATSAVYEVWTNTTTTYTLPAASGYDGKAVIFYVTGTNAITIDPNSSEVIVRDGTAQTGGVTLTLTGAAGNYVCLICDGTRWISLGYKGVLAAGS